MTAFIALIGERVLNTALKFIHHSLIKDFITLLRDTDRQRGKMTGGRLGKEGEEYLCLHDKRKG